LMATALEYSPPRVPRSVIVLSANTGPEIQKAPATVVNAKHLGMAIK